MELLDVTGSRETWLMIKSVATVEGSEAPAMQLADLLAWGTNRYLCAQEGDFMKHLAPIIQQVVPNSSIHLNDSNLKGVVFV
jgi:hypothetical protein